MKHESDILHSIRSGRESALLILSLPGTGVGGVEKTLCTVYRPDRPFDVNKEGEKRDGEHLYRRIVSIYRIQPHSLPRGGQDAGNAGEPGI